MKEMQVPESEIAEFQDASHWLRYFPPIAREDLKRLGLKIDFRRSFITTEINPYYDAFIRWQFNQLRQKQKVAFGNRPCIFSPIDDQACADHDRASGEGVGPQEYVIIKLKVLDPLPAKSAALKPLMDAGKTVILAAATLRPETMYGQTNCWVLPDGEYGAFEMNNNEVWICSHRSALNMSYQNLTPVRGKPNCLLTLKGSDLMGCAVRAPNASFERVYVLPLFSISMDKTTGVVTSVPSDAPDDYAALLDVKKKAALRSMFDLRDDQVLPFEVVPIINVPEFGTQSAVEACTRLNIKSPNDRALLDQAKELVYMKGFYEGVMMVGPHAGKKVQDAKPLIRAEMIAAGEAALYNEPESLVISRSGCECVVALADQWYLKYGTGADAEWAAAVAEHVANRLECFTEAAHTKFKTAAGWLKEWACSRTYGLGTRMPWDEQFLIESLSDSTIYMAYYTIAHFLQEGELEGTGAHPIAASQLTDEVFNHVFLDGPVPADCTIPAETLTKMRREFKYWYPLDLRVSGKDLIPNHLTMSVYNHAAIWDKEPEMWPRAFFTNGHIMVDNQKMSKSLGNFLTVDYCIKQFGADATRLALADAGDSLEDANFSSDTVNAGILRLTKELDWFLEVIQGQDSLRTGDKDFFDNVFLNEISQSIVNTDRAYAGMMFREVLKYGLYELSLKRDAYRVAATSGMHRDVVHRFMEVQLLMLSPICPHICEYLWAKLGKQGLIVNALWPQAEAIDPTLVRRADYLNVVSAVVRSECVNAEEKRVRRMEYNAKKGLPADEPPISTCTISVALQFPAWQQELINTCAALWDDNARAYSAEVSKVLAKSDALKKRMKRAMELASNLRMAAEVRGREAFELITPFDELALLNEHRDLIARSLPVQNFVFVAQDVNAVVDEKEQATPGKPIIKFT
jgi:leucyl-tRNA synthetase